MSDFEELFGLGKKDKLLANEKANGGLRGQRTGANKVMYDSLTKVEKQKFALDTLASDEFQDTLRRYYTSRGDDADFANMNKEQMTEYFYKDRIWNENNTIGLSSELLDVTGATDDEKADFARITQTYANLPYFGSGSSYSWKQWSWDFGKAIIADPANLIGFGVGGAVAKLTGKQAVKEGTKQLTKSAIKTKAVKAGAMAGAVEGGVVTAGADAIRQNTEIEANMTDEYNITRTAIAGFTGAGFGGVIGGGGAYVSSSWATKKKSGNYVTEQNGKAYDREQTFGEAGTNGDKTYSGETGTVIEHEPSTTVKTKNGEIPKEKLTKNQQELVDSIVNDGKKVETKPKKKVETKNKKETEHKRGTYFNFKHYDPQNSQATPAVKEIKKTIQKMKKDKTIRTEVRVGLLNKILEKAKVKVHAKDKAQWEMEVKQLAEIDEDMAINNVALKIQILQQANDAVELKIKAEKIPADNPDAQLAILTEKMNIIESLTNKIAQKDTISRMGSDTLQSEKIDIPLDNTVTGDYLQTAQVKDMMNTIKNEADPIKKEQIVDDLIDNLSSEMQMKTIIQKHNADGSKHKANWADALNEFTTANLLGDLTTHQVNVLSAGIKYQKGIIDDFVSGIMHTFSSKNRHMAYPQMQMAMDMMTGQFRFWGIAFKKAKLSWKMNRSVGDALEHKFDGVKERQMAEWTKQLREEGNIAQRLASRPLDMIGKISFTTLKALQFGDTLLKNVFNRAGRVASVNQRMRKFYPELWKNRKGNKRNIVKLKENIKHVESLIRFRKSQKKDVTKLEAKLLKLQNKSKTQSTFEEKWSELYFQYEDRFADFRSTKNFTPDETATLDDLTKSIANDPMYKAQESTFTQTLKSKELGLKDKQGNDLSDGIANSILKWAHKHPFIRVLTGIHFVKTPANLLRYAWYSTPALNRLSKQYNAMLRSPDPVIRAKARSYEATGTAMLGASMYLATQGQLKGGSDKDHAKRYSYVHTTASGEKKYYQFSRLWPLSIPLMWSADVVEGMNKWSDTFNDPLRSDSQKKLTDHMLFISGHMMGMFTNTFTSNFMTADAFKLMGALVDNKAGDAEEADGIVESVLKDMNRKSTKLIPLATTWRWTNKMIAEAEAESRNLLDEWVKSTPFELAKKLNIPYADLYSKRDMFGNKLQSPKGMLLGAMQDPVKTTISIAEHEDFKGLTPSEKDKLVRLSEQSGWRKMLNKVDVGLTERLDLNHYEVTSGFFDAKPKDPMTLYEAIQDLKGTVTLQGRTLNEEIAYQISNPNSDLNKYTVDKLIGGKHNQAQFLKEIVSNYETYAKDIVFNKYKFEYQGQKVTIEDLKKISGLTESLVIKEERNKSKGGDFESLFGVSR